VGEPNDVGALDVDPLEKLVNGLLPQLAGYGWVGPQVPEPFEEALRTVQAHLIDWR
jgi:hypothetical protein